MLVTVINEMDNGAQVWTLCLSEEEYSELFEKYAHRGISVIVDRDQVADEIEQFWK